MTKRLLTGDRPTGKFHLGHYVGSLSNRVKLQYDYECFFIIADLHVLTTKNDPDSIAQSCDHARQLVIDALACGLQPEHCTFYLQSAIPELHELYTLFQNLVTVPRLNRIPSLKDMVQHAGLNEMTYGLLGYPILQTADILCTRAQVVPVGKDNYAHLELTREIAKRFNHLYGEVFSIPETVISDHQSLIGTDGKHKMSKSLDNAIFLNDDVQTVVQKVNKMYTDPNRITADTPGETENNPIFIYHKLFNDRQDEVADLKARYENGKVGDSEVKSKLAEALNRFLDPIRERRAHIESQKGWVDSLIVQGTDRVRKEVQETVLLTRKAMGLQSNWNRLRRKAEQYKSL